MIYRSPCPSVATVMVLAAALTAPAEEPHTFFDNGAAGPLYYYSGFAADP